MPLAAKMMNVVVEDACCTVTLDGPGYESKITEYGGPATEVSVSGLYYTRG